MYETCTYVHFLFLSVRNLYVRTFRTGFVHFVQVSYIRNLYETCTEPARDRAVGSQRGQDVYFLAVCGRRSLMSDFLAGVNCIDWIGLGWTGLG